MKHVATILLAGLFLGQSLSAAVTEVFKIGELIEHAQMHSEEYGDSFFTFISKHYGEQQPEHSSDHQEHDNLPFHHMQGTQMIVMYVSAIQEDLAKPDDLDGDQINGSFYEESITNFVITKIFQPPILS